MPCPTVLAETKQKLRLIYWTTTIGGQNCYLIKVLPKKCALVSMSGGNLISPNMGSKTHADISSKPTVKQNFNHTIHIETKLHSITPHTACWLYSLFIESLNYANISVWVEEVHFHFWNNFLCNSFVCYNKRVIINDTQIHTFWLSCFGCSLFIFPSLPTLYTLFYKIDKYDSWLLFQLPIKFELKTASFNLKASF